MILLSGCSIGITVGAGPRYPAPFISGCSIGITVVAPYICFIERHLAVLTQIVLWYCAAVNLLPSPPRAQGKQLRGNHLSQDKFSFSCLSLDNGWKAWHVSLRIYLTLWRPTECEERQGFPATRVYCTFTQNRWRIAYTVRICYSVGLWFSKIYHYNWCIITSDMHSLHSDRELLFPAWAYPWKIYKISNSIGCRIVSEPFSPIFLSSLAIRRKRKIVERKAQKCRALACLAITISDTFCAEFDGLIFQFLLLYPIYHYSRYALDIVIFWLSFWGFDFDFCQSYHNIR